jgi:hypothetical protein
VKILQSCKAIKFLIKPHRNNLSMRKVFLLITGLLPVIVSVAQNTFPSNGNVGIGTSSPQKILHLSGLDEVEQLIETTNDGFSSITFKSNGKKWHWSKRPASVGDAFQLYYHDGASWSAPYVSFLPNSNMGLGTANPQAKLHIQGGSLGSNVGNTIDLLKLHSAGGSGGNNSYLDFFTYRFASGNDWLTSSTRIQQTIDGSKQAFIEFNPENMRWGMALGTNSTARLYIGDNGRVGIGTTNINDANYKLFVETGIRTRKVKVDVNSWADYVFSPTYKLPTLKEVEIFIKQHQHLPDVPSEAEVKKEGLDLGDSQALLLKKIEELTLYVIEQNKRTEKQNENIRTQQKELEELKTTLKKLQSNV